MLRRVVFSLSAVAILLVASHVQAARCCNGASVSRDCDGNYTVTVMCPVKEIQTRTRLVQKCRTEERTKTYTVVRMVPETKQVEEKYTVLVPQKRTKTVNYTVRKPVWEEHQVNYTVRVPVQEQRTGYCMVHKVVQIPGTREVTVRGGYWQHYTKTVPGRDACGCPCCYTVCCKKWCPTCCTKVVPTCECKVVCEKRPYTYCVTSYKCETRCKTVKKCRYVCEQRSRKICHMVCVPECRTRTRCVTTYRRVCEERTDTYCVRIPYWETEKYQVTVCRLVPKTTTILCDSCEGRGCDGSCCDIAPSCCLPGSDGIRALRTMRCRSPCCGG